jgi:hypothetical protein
VQPNSILLAWPDDWSKNSDSGAAFVSIVKGAVQAHKAVMVRNDARLCHYFNYHVPNTIRNTRAVYSSELVLRLL